MPEEVEFVPVTRISETERVDLKDSVVAEFPLTIILNDQELVTLLCSPAKIKYLALGFLASEGLLRSREEIAKVMVNQRRGVVRVSTKVPTAIEGNQIFKRFITSGCGKGTAFTSVADALNRKKVESEVTLSKGQVFALMKRFQGHSEIYRNTGGIHSCALLNGEKIIVFSEDVGRHNAVDKIFGECLLEGISTQDRVIVTSGRISSEILGKVAQKSVPIIISRSATTDMAIRTASNLGVTLVGYVRGKRMNVYTNSWRIRDE